MATPSPSTPLGPGAWQWTYLSDPGNDQLARGGGIGLGTCSAGGYFNALVLDTAGNIWTCWLDGTTWRWAKLGQPNPGGAKLTTPLGTVTANGLPNVLALDAEGTLWTCYYYDNGWQWANLGRPASGHRPTRAAGTLEADGTAYAFVLDEYDALWVCQCNPSWQWVSLGTPPPHPQATLAPGQLAEPAGTQLVAGNPTVFITDTHGTLLTCQLVHGSWGWGSLQTPGKTLVGPWTPPEPPDPKQPVVALPLGTTRAGGDANVLVLDQFGTLWNCWLVPGGGWHWEAQGQPSAGTTLDSSLGTLDDGSDAYVFALDTQQNVWACWYSTGGWQWSNLGAPANSPGAAVALSVVQPVGTGVVGQSPALFNLDTLGNLWGLASPALPATLG
ncbi:MAG: hypothetical protein EOO59_07890 [Hymenobacter sp.]|nr:MAG: hypothetical protein EOO59_07890 [Hymenobacter sp.]